MQKNEGIDVREILQIYRYPSVWIPHLIGAIIALVLPEDVMSESQWLQAVFSVTSNVIPSIQGFVKNSAFPEVTATYFSISSITGFFVCAALSKRPELLMPHGVKALRNFGNFPSLFLILGSLITLGLCVFACIHSGKPWQLLPIHDSRLTLALIGPLFAWMPFYMFAAFIAVVKTWRTYS
jgi:hypothetical protein